MQFKKISTNWIVYLTLYAVLTIVAFNVINYFNSKAAIGFFILMACVYFILVIRALKK